MEKLPWFKFTPEDWVMGRIQRCEEVTQARFMRLICVYWKKHCIVSYEDAEIEIDKYHLDALISKRVIKCFNNFIVIDFLNEQLDDIQIDVTDKSKAGKIGNLKRWRPELYNKYMNNEISLENALSIAEESHPDRTPIAPRSQNIADIDIDKELDKEKKKKTIVTLNNSLLSEIKISDDKLFFICKDVYFDADEKSISYFEIARKFQLLFIKNLKDKYSPFSVQENATYKNYIPPIRIMIEKENVTIENLRDAYNYLNSSSGDFWKSNVLSTSKLREKISQLLIKKNTSNGTQPTSTSKRPAKFTITGAEKTLASDFERRQS